MHDASLATTFLNHHMTAQSLVDSAEGWITSTRCVLTLQMLTKAAQDEMDAALDAVCVDAEYGDGVTGLMIPFEWIDIPPMPEQLIEKAA